MTTKRIRWLISVSLTRLYCQNMVCMRQVRLEKELFVIFLRDPLTAQAHEPDIQALIRLCDVYSVPIATNLASAEIFIRALNDGELNWRLD